jgi:hypothetical protein
MQEKQRPESHSLKRLAHRVGSHKVAANLVGAHPVGESFEAVNIKLQASREASDATHHPQQAPIKPKH